MVSPIKRALDSLVVYDCAGYHKVRVGGAHDGGYVLLEELCALTTEVYSFGVGDDVSFEMDFILRWPGVQVYLFDPTVDGPPVRPSQFHFSREGIDHDHLPTIVPDEAALLKMDIEADEWWALQNPALLALLDQFSQVVVELHFVHAEPRKGLYPYWRGFYERALGRINRGLFRQYHEVIETLSRTFCCYHVHANNSLPVITVDGRTFPPLLETSWARKDLVGDVRIAEGPFPVDGLDAPNKTDRPDITGYYPLGGGSWL